MKVLMLGWEYPPHISGGLGTACKGLSEALADSGVSIDFVVPRLLGGETAEHVNLIGAEHGTKILAASTSPKIRAIPIAAYLRPYLTTNEYKLTLAESSRYQNEHGAAHYGSDLISEVARYSDSVVNNLANYDFDLIHAHDWMTFTAALSMAATFNKPMIAHVHSLEFDRSGGGANEQIEYIEQLGLNGAQKILAVSHYTKAIITKHGIDPDKVEVVHNGVYPGKVLNEYRKNDDQKMVLFLGRITFQKGPEYFIQAARKVIDIMPDAKFVMAGDGDMLPRMKELVATLEINDNFSFPGFLRGEEVEEMYARATLYVMPSVSEPFGIAPLEAINADTPVVISRQSGVSEVIRHAFKFDFWDTDRLALYMLNALTYPEIRNDMVVMARREVERVRWESAAQKVIGIYNQLI